MIPGRQTYPCRNQIGNNCQFPTQRSCLLLLSSFNAMCPSVKGCCYTCHQSRLPVARDLAVSSAPDGVLGSIFRMCNSKLVHFPYHQNPQIKSGVPFFWIFLVHHHSEIVVSAVRHLHFLGLHLHSVGRDFNSKLKTAYHVRVVPEKIGFNMIQHSLPWSARFSFIDSLFQSIT